MIIKIEWHDKSFNVNLHSNEESDAFLSIKGCRIVSSAKGEFVSFPASKNEKSGKWWNHVWGSPEFQSAVLAKAQAKPKAAPAKTGTIDDLDDIPFANPYRSFLQCHVV